MPELTFEYYMEHASVSRMKNKASIILGDDIMVTENVIWMSDDQLKAESWETFAMMASSEMTEEIEQMIDQGQKDLLNALIETYDEHCFIKITYEIDEKAAQAAYDKDVAQGNDMPYDKWLLFRKAQALEFEMNTI